MITDYSKYDNSINGTSNEKMIIQEFKIKENKSGL